MCITLQNSARSSKACCLSRCGAPSSELVQCYLPSLVWLHYHFMHVRVVNPVVNSTSFSLTWIKHSTQPTLVMCTHGGWSSTEALWRVNIIRDLRKCLFPNRARIAARAWPTTSRSLWQVSISVYRLCPLSCVAWLPCCCSWNKKVSFITRFL